jgi:hypothetical protein
MAEPVTPYKTYPTIPTGVVTRQPGSKFTSSRDGSCTLVETYVGNFADILNGNLAVSGSNNVEFPTLVVWSSSVVQGKAGVATLTVESRGVIGGLPDPTYTIDRATHNEPLSTHPLWVSQIAGTPAAPLNGAIFVDPVTGAVSSSSNAVFKGWTAGSIFEGIEDYLLAGTTFTISYADYSPPDLSGVGQLATPQNAPDTSSGFFWLYTGASSVQHGNIYRIQETYLLTGGVNQDATTIIYGSS